jgi:hypothetical protein
MTQNKALLPRPFVQSFTPLRPERKIVLVDMDGTLSDCSHREHHIQGNPPDWPAFFRGMGQDPPNVSIVDLTRRLAANHDILIVTGRPQEFLRETHDWLTRNSISPNEIWMRRAGDHRPDFVVKREVLDHIPRDRVVFVLDDRERVCDMWDSEGLTCHRVKQGECELTRRG